MQAEEPLLILIKLLLAHVLADFAIQGKNWVTHRNKFKHRSYYLYLNAFASAALAYIFVARWNLWIIPIATFVTHVLIDIWKSHQKENSRNFFIDQSMHLAVIFLLWLFVTPGVNFNTSVLQWFNNYQLWVIALAYAIVIYPAGIVISILTRHWQKDIKKTGLKGLDKAGLWIGRLERLIILTMLFFSFYQAIGFLIAAKSIFRFAEIKQSGDRKMAEYVLIGTLYSVLFALITGLIAMKMLIII